MCPLTFLFFISFLLRVSFFVLRFPTMEDKTDIKWERSPSMEGNPAASNAKTPPPTPSETPSPLGSPADVSSRKPLSSVFEQGGSLREGSSGGSIFIFGWGRTHPWYARDFEFTQRLFGELNRDLLGPPDDGKVIILSDSDKEKEEAHDEKSAGVKDVATFVIVNWVSTASADDIGTPSEKSSTPAASPADADNDPRVEPNDSSDGPAPGLKVEEGDDDRDEVGAP
jgi:hypothetical protein